MCERVWRTSALEREKEEEREQKKEGEREREKKEKEGEGEGELSLFYLHFLLFSSWYASLHFSFWIHSDDVATLFPSSSLSHNLSHFLSIFSTHTHSRAFSLSLFSLSLSFSLLPVSFSFSLLSLPPISLSLSLSLLPPRLSLFPPPSNRYTHVHNRSHAYSRSLKRKHTYALPTHFLSPPPSLSPFHLCVFSIFCVSHHEYM